MLSADFLSKHAIKMFNCFILGEHVVQTCFQGRFGEELGSSQFGGTIMVHQKDMEQNTEIAQAHIEYTEVTFAGQAFRLGRYPIHFHLNGDMSSSYVKGCAVHKSFNRAINIHGTHNTTVEWNVVYDIMGGALFLEDGIETGNIFQYNLGVFVVATSSLINDDITPAVFWVTNANNILRHNAAAGGTHFGYWYRMHQHPDGPSYTKEICPRTTPLGEFYNNSAHSFGWFGVWTFQQWTSMKNGNCIASVANSEAAKFRNLIVWNCEKGFETVESGAVQCIECVFVQNKLSGFEGIKLMNVPKRSPDSSMVKDSLIVGRTNSESLWLDSHGVTDSGIVIPFGAGFAIENVKFMNLDVDSSRGLHWAIKGLCPDHCGGYSVQSSKLSWDKVNKRGKWRWIFEGTVEDMDDTLCGDGTGGPKKITPKLAGDSYPASCTPCDKFDSTLIDSYSCPWGVEFHRFAFNEIYPTSLAAKSLMLTNSQGTNIAPFMKKRFTHKPGWMAVLVDGETYTFEFEGAPQMTNISFVGRFDEFAVNA